MNTVEMQKKAAQIRSNALQMRHHARASYSDASLSHVNIMVVLYYGVMKLDPLHPAWDERDRFVYCLNYSAESLYCILADQGFFPAHELQTFRRYGTRLTGHVNRKVPGIEVTGGVSGHGLSIAVGMALSARMNKQDHRVFTLMGEAELSQGKVWEAALSASRYNLDNLVNIVDLESGRVHEWIEAWRYFGWNVVIIDGGRIDELYQALQQPGHRSGKPLLLVAKKLEEGGR